MQSRIFFRLTIACAVVALSAAVDSVSADYFATPPCLSSPGCVFFSPKFPAPGQKIEVAIVPSLPADARVGNLTQTVSGKLIEISAPFVHCNCVFFPEPPPMFLYTSLEPLAAGHYSVRVTFSPDPPEAWPDGDQGAFLAPIVLSATLDVVTTPPPPANYQGLWWNAPAGSEPGWGINVAHQGDVIVATWFTYDLAGKGWWLVMTAPKAGPDAYPDTYIGTLYQATGPAFNAVPFNPAQVTATPVGSGTLTFTDANNGTLRYSVYGFGGFKALTREVFGPMPGCTFAAQPVLGAATNYQDLWWAAPPGSESGWGINLTHQGDTIFATWFTYDLDHSPMWLVVTAPLIAPGVYSGTLYRTTGPPLSTFISDPALTTVTAVGTATLTFIDGNNASFAYTVNGVMQSKAITRELFASPVTICE